MPIAVDLTLDYVLLAIYCVSFPVYSRVLWIAAHVSPNDKTLSPEFFRLILSTGIADLAAGLHTYLYLRIRLWG